MGVAKLKGKLTKLSKIYGKKIDEENRKLFEEYHITENTDNYLHGGSFDNADFNTGYQTVSAYQKRTGEDIMLTRGSEEKDFVKKHNAETKKRAEDRRQVRAKLKSGKIYQSAVNKIHLIKVENDLPPNEADIPSQFNLHRQFTSFTDLCKYSVGAQSYDPDDFLYCADFGMPINHLITLRRFPSPCTDNIWDKDNAGEPDIARMVCYFTQEKNKLDDILKFSYALQWKELESEMEEGRMVGEQVGLAGNVGKVMKYIDPVMYKDLARGENSYNFDPKYDQNKVYGPVDSIKKTNIRDVGLNFEKEFDLIFDYELRSINGRTPEYAMRDILGNVLAVTFNNGKFWGGSRYWVGKRPAKYLKHFQWMNGIGGSADPMDNILLGFKKAFEGIVSTVKNFISNPSSALGALKKITTGAVHIAVGKFLDTMGRPGIPASNSLLSGEPTGFWHLTVGNPQNPILCLGNLICTGVDVNFPTDNLSFLEFPTKMSFTVKLKSAMPKDRAGIEMMFNTGKSRLYYAPKKIKNTKNNHNLSRVSRSFFGYENHAVERMISDAFDFMPCIASEVKNVVVKYKEKGKNGKEVTKSKSVEDTVKRFDKIQIEGSGESTSEFKPIQHKKTVANPNQKRLEDVPVLLKDMATRL